MSVSENILKSASFEDAKKLFSEESNYIKTVRNIAKRMNATSYEEVYALMTGNGGKLNIVL